MDYISDPQLYRIEQIMHGSTFPWYIAGGWSIDLALGRKTRNHKDMDIVVYREYLQDVLDFFYKWDIGVAIPGEHRLEAVLDMTSIQPPQYCLHISNGQDFVEVLITDTQDEAVIFRRNTNIKMGFADFIRTDNNNRLFVTPEWQLLFKSKDPRIEDQQDFMNSVPALSSKQKSWLCESIRKMNKNHSWIIVLEESMSF